MGPERKRPLRCAIYTRKSSEEGLEQTFNSLAAQREACVAFIHSQRHEGWRVLETHYDDGGYSGGSLERPALQRLLADLANWWSTRPKPSGYEASISAIWSFAVCPS